MTVPPSPRVDRRHFIAASGAAALTAALPRPADAARPQVRGGPVVISSGNGLVAVARALAQLNDGVDPAAAVVHGVAAVEDDPRDMSVGLGGLPNEQGVVQLDASVMHGPTHKAGAVAGLENVRNAAAVALEVLRRTDHVLLVGAGALAFARACGFEEENLLTERARQAWLKWKGNLNPDDDWLDDDQLVTPAPDSRAHAGPTPHTHGTIHCAALNDQGDLGACTTTSGLSYKIPGRVGDSPIIGAGMYVENDIGAAGATGRGESVIQSCGAFQIVQHMGRGDHPTAACLKVLEWIARHTRRPALLNDRGQPNFGCTMYAVRKDGAYGSATMRGRNVQFAVADAAGARKEECAVLYG
ncbi:MAG: N(4)-(beta-N-acetylglucosaminyl)-L-asparaginase [Phycisphaerales bacterium]|nr:N(4)-(beta-N-acetylglucosaminyl)-L-asparaginase [Phycisphaerales bacterium]NNM25281.1 N(4)-(beta-N-acetylglucosaminyl)-L-asparaginase [Phycisphaerales bacterium]